jgi:hypothetical protein
MPVRGLLVALVVCGVLAGLVYWSDKTKTAEEAKAAAEPANKLLKIKDEDVRKIEIVHKDTPPTVIELGANNQWEMKSPEPLRVDQDSAKSLVSAYTGLTSDRVIEEKATDMAPFGLNTPAAEVRVATKDGKTTRLLIGDETPTSGGFFAKLDNDPKVFTITSGTKSSLDKSAKDIRDQRLLTFDSDKLTRVTLTAKGQSMEFGKNNNNEWQILKPRPLRADNGQVEELVRKLKDAKMDVSLSDEETKKLAASYASSPRIAVATVTDASGTQTIEVHKNAKDNSYYAKSTAIEGIHKVADDLGQGVDKALEDFRNKKLFDFGFAEPTKVEVRDGTNTYAFQKSGEKWTAGGKEMDSVGIQSLIDKLRDLSSIKFVDSGFTTPAIDLAVTSTDGKRVEKVQISKSGNQYFARRENEPAIYELDSKAVEEMLRAAADVKPPPPPAAPAKK